MEIAIIGWYGTETIGDRAILAGIINTLSKVYDSFTINLGSLYPFYTSRTVLEDLNFYKKVSKERLYELKIFNSLDPHELKTAINSCQVLMVGGGPLMDLAEMNMLEYAFLYATRKKKKKVIFGSGWGPLRNEYRIRQACNLVKLADFTIFRDSISLEECKNYIPVDDSKVKSSIDPACFACQNFMENAPEKRNDHISVNFRDVSLEGKHYSDRAIPDDIFVDLVKAIKDKVSLPIHLVPMHNFFIGGDDRIFLNTIEKLINDPQIRVLHRPLSLFETMEEYFHAKMCVGMRFHSVLLQTLLNGNNYIVDYTDPNKGKIKGLIDEFGMIDEYKSRYFSLYDDSPKKFGFDSTSNYNYSSAFVNNNSSIYCSFLKQLGL